MVNEALLIAGGTVAGVVLGKGIEFFTAKWKAKREDREGDASIRKSEVEQATSLLREIIADLRAEIKSLDHLIQVQDHDRLSCREEKAALKVELKTIKRWAEAEGLRFDPDQPPRADG